MRAMAYVAAAVLALAGCLSDETEAPEQPEPPAPRVPPTDDEPAERSPPDEPAPVTGLGWVHLPSCDQFHTFYTSPASGFETTAPDGFTLVTDDELGLTTTVVVYVWSCDQAHLIDSPLSGTAPEGPVGVFLAAVQVEPPAELALEAVDLELFPLSAGVLGERLHGQLALWGMDERSVAGDLAVANLQDDDAALVEEVVFATADETYRVASAVQREGGTFAALLLRLWVPDGAGVSGAIFVVQGEAENVGTGSATFTYQGPSDAPPVAPGLSHRVAAVEMSLSHRGMDALTDPAAP